MTGEYREGHAPPRPSPHRRTRVCFLGHSAAVSGAEIALQRLLGALDVDAVVVLAEDGPMVGRLAAEGVDVRVVALPPQLSSVRRDAGPRAVLRTLGSWMRFLRAVRAAVAACNADVVHTNSMKAHLYGGLVGRSLGLPVVWHVRDRLTPDYLSRSLSVLMRVLVRLVPHAVIVPSASVAATLGGADATVVPDNQVFRGEGAESTSVVRERVLTVGMIGRLSPWKGQDVFLRALLTGALPHTRVRLIGSAMFDDADFEETLRILAQRLGPGRVEFRGFCDDVLAELSELDVVVHASRIAEPFGQVVVEAMAAGVPVVASDDGGPAEVITHGVDGLLTRPGDVEALAAALDTLDDRDRRQDLADAAGRSSVRYTPARTAEGVLAAYARVIGSPRCSGPASSS